MTKYFSNLDIFIELGFHYWWAGFGYFQSPPLLFPLSPYLIFLVWG